MPAFKADGFCPYCGEVMGKFGDQWAMCQSKGKRGVRHSEIRNVVNSEGHDGGQNPGKEKKSVCCLSGLWKTV